MDLLIDWSIILKALKHNYSFLINKRSKSWLIFIYFWLVDISIGCSIYRVLNTYKNIHTCRQTATFSLNKYIKKNIIKWIHKWDILSISRIIKSIDFFISCENYHNFTFRIFSQRRFRNIVQHIASRSPLEKENYWHYRNIRHTGRPHIDGKLRCTTSEEWRLYKVLEVLVADKGRSGMEDLD